jgi:hypothetical protein
VLRATPLFLVRRPKTARGKGPKKKRKRRRRKTTYLVPTSLPFFSEVFLDFPILENLLLVFLGSSCRETAKNAIDDRKKVLFFSAFRPKVFGMDFPQKVVHGVFELPLLRNAQKRFF